MISSEVVQIKALVSVAGDYALLSTAAPLGYLEMMTRMADRGDAISGKTLIMMRFLTMKILQMTKRRLFQKTTKRMNLRRRWKCVSGMTPHFVNWANPCQERLQREYMSANKQRDVGIDESDEEDLDPTLTGAGKAIKKLMNKHEKNGAYESDEESNPYASSAVRFGLVVLRNLLTDYTGGRGGGRTYNC